MTRKCRRPKAPKVPEGFEMMFYAKSLSKWGNGQDIIDITKEILRRGLKGYRYDTDDMTSFMVKPEDVETYPYARHDGDGPSYLLPLPDCMGETNGHWLPWHFKMPDDVPPFYMREIRDADWVLITEEAFPSKD